MAQSSPYWRSTQQLFNQATGDCSESNPSTFVASNFHRWDELFGRVGMYADDIEDESGCDSYLDQGCGGGGCNCCGQETISECVATGGDCAGVPEANVTQICPLSYVANFNKQVRNPTCTDTNNFWSLMPPANTASNGMSNAAKGMNQYYRDPEPIPKLWLQIQPAIWSYNWTWK